MSAQLYFCGCDGCDRETIHPDEYCLVCQDNGCGYEARCP